MLKKVVVNIVSEQTIPNFLFIKEFQNEADLFLFISTEEMERKQKSKTIYETAGINKNNVRKTLIEEDSLYLAKERLDKLGWTAETHTFLVNITGGTKLMSNAVYNYFKIFNSRFFYLPLDKNIIKEVFDDRRAEIFPVKYKISVPEYLRLFNIHFKEDQQIFDEKKTWNWYSILKKNKFHPVPIDIGIKTNLGLQQKYAKWFEHFLYFKIKKFLKLNDNEIKMSLKLFKENKENRYPDNINDNEIDVVFIHNNKCYIIEAKVSAGADKINTSAITNYLYKLAAVNKRFGINARAALMLFSNLSSLSEQSVKNLEKRCEILNLPYPFDRNDIKNEEKFKNRLLTFLK